MYIYNIITKKSPSMFTKSCGKSYYKQIVKQPNKIEYITYIYKVNIDEDVN